MGLIHASRDGRAELARRPAWSRGCETGLPALDADHQDLFRRALALSVGVDPGEGRDMLVQRLDRLTDELVGHCLQEERLMRASGYPALAIHQQDHADLLAELLTWRTSLRDAPLTVHPEAVALVLADLLLQHFTGLDRGLARFLDRASSQ